jgi:chromosomal replication initiator protein
MMSPALVRVSTHHKLATMAKAVNMMKARVAGNGVHTMRTRLSAAWQTSPPAPSTKDKPCSSNIRELEGTLIRVTAFANLNKQPVDLALVQTVLKDVITLDESNMVGPLDIMNTTASYFKLSLDELTGSSRAQAIAMARQIAMYLCREMTNLSLPKIGQLFGGRDHTTVMHACKKIADLMKERRSVYNQVTEVSSLIKQRSTYSN